MIVRNCLSLLSELSTLEDLLFELETSIESQDYASWSATLSKLNELKSKKD